MVELPLMTEAVGEVVKLRLVEWWQKSLSRYRSKQRATQVCHVIHVSCIFHRMDLDPIIHPVSMQDERREDIKRKRAFFSRILEDDSSAEARNVDVDLDAISEAETPDLILLVL